MCLLKYIILLSVEYDYLRNIYGRAYGCSLPLILSSNEDSGESVQMYILIRALVACNVQSIDVTEDYDKHLDLARQPYQSNQGSHTQIVDLEEFLAELLYYGHHCIQVVAEKSLA